MSGLVLSTSRIARSALEKFIGLGLALRRAAIFSTFFFLLSRMALIHADWGWICPGFSAARSADMAEPISATMGAAMGRLLSISVGEMSVWMCCAVCGHL